ncbi:MAG: BrnA antitoxin family protein [Sulfuricurvum sp.]
MRKVLETMEETYDIPDEVDMSEAIRGYFYTPHKVSVNIRLDDDIVIYFKKRSLAEKQGYQTLMNTALRYYIQTHDKAI